MNSRDIEPKVICKSGIFWGDAVFRLLAGASVRVKFRDLSIIFAGCIISSIACANVTIEVCYDFGCQSLQEVRLSGKEWSSIRAIFDAEDAVEERGQIKRAVARMESLAGLYTPTHLDKGGNMPIQRSDERLVRLPGQLDCIDESINTSQYLELFEGAGLLKFHDAAGRVYRRSFLSQHWAAQVREKKTGRHFVVDSWFEDNGEPPVLVASEVWHDLSL